jgi:hypothetical protein
LLCGFSLSAEVVDIGVFGLFRPVELRVTPASGPLLVTSGDARVELEGRQSFSIRLGRFSGQVRVGARDGSATDFRLSVPGKIERQFHGTLVVRALPHKLQALVTMDREVAVASVVAAEMPATAPFEALKAQAVVARSYYAAGHDRHNGFEFCDTTHCQFLRAWPDAASPAFRATRDTRGLVLEYLGQPLAALYSASCGGQTRAFQDTGGEETGAYPYYSVACDFCRRHAPGVVHGHQLGLCQAGAAGMAASGATFQAILDHYLPGTAIFLLPPSPTLRHSND